MDKREVLPEIIDKRIGQTAEDPTTYAYRIVRNEINHFNKTAAMQEENKNKEIVDLLAPEYLDALKINGFKYPDTYETKFSVAELKAASIQCASISIEFAKGLIEWANKMQYYQIDYPESKYAWLWFISEKIDDSEGITTDQLIHAYIESKK